jgi:hypothetical protein
MPRMRIDRVKCVQCEHYEEDGIVNRCYVPGNVYHNWMGKVYRLPPTKKNYNGQCPDYKEKTDGS